MTMKPIIIILNMAKMKGFYTKGRRELIAKAFITLVQIAVGGAIAGNIFMKFTPAVKTVATLSIITLFILAIIVCPKRSDE